MKRLFSTGLGAEPITIDKESSLWKKKKGLLGDQNPQALLDTMMYYCGLYFVLRSGQEHRSLQLDQFELIKATDKAPACLKYHKNFSKNNHSGMAH